MLVYKFVFVRRLVLNVHFVCAVLQPLLVSFVSYLLLICFIGFLHLILYPDVYIMPILPFFKTLYISNTNIKIVGKHKIVGNLNTKNTIKKLSFTPSYSITINVMFYRILSSPVWSRYFKTFLLSFNFASYDLLTIQRSCQQVNFTLKLTNSLIC